MKKKIKDLTKEEMKKFCHDRRDSGHFCWDCPLGVGFDSCLENYDLDKEIEVLNEQDNEKTK